MKKTFWKKLPKPFFCLAPMSDVTDAAFRRIIAKYSKENLPASGGPDVMWTEFVSADGLALGNKDEIIKNLKFTAKERPIVAQIFGANPDNIAKAARIIQDLKFDGLDINMGCPDKKVEKQGAGAGLMKDAKLAQKIITAAKKGALKLPISIKTRIGYSKNEIQTWIPALLKTDISALTIHFRTRKEMSRVPAKWHLANEIVRMRDEIAPNTLIIGNGDVSDLEDARAKAKDTGVDGIMIGRGVFGNPWFFSGKTTDTHDKLRVLIEHAKLFEKLCKHKSFAVMKKHFKAYISGWDGAKQLRMKLMSAKNADDVEKIIKKSMHK
ncbi:tRNA-dihydrouridine synthase [Patescibacteria group bacterium]|nr:tRNA-dihydrouridine synthase [Patescibacteria group bacterium]